MLRRVVLLCLFLACAAVCPQGEAAKKKALKKQPPVRRPASSQKYKAVAKPPTRSPLNTVLEAVTPPPAVTSLGEKAVLSLDRLIKKKSFELMGDPWTVQGLPIFFITKHQGSNLGVHVSLYNIRRQDPHKLKLSGQVLASDRGRMRHFLLVDSPHAFDGQFRIRGRVSLNRDIMRRYFGISNTTDVNDDWVENENPIYLNTRLQPRLDVEVLKRFGKYLTIGPVFGVATTTISYPTGSLMDIEKPVGIAGGRTNYLGVAIINDTTDFEPYPARGTSHELYLTIYNNVIGSDYNFFRGTYTFRKYWPLDRTLTLAHRTFFEAMVGNTPFYELGSTGGQDPSQGFGFSRFLRGVYENQYIGDIKFATSVEMRWDPITFYFKRQRVTVGFVPFLDIARVWNKNQPVTFGPFHGAVGLGLRSIWNYRMVLRADFGLSREGTTFNVEFGNAF